MTPLDMKSSATVEQTETETPIANENDGKKLFNRELSWLEFNRRVLDEAMDESLPVLERLKFLSHLLDQSR